MPEPADRPAPPLPATDDVGPLGTDGLSMPPTDAVGPPGTDGLSMPPTDALGMPADEMRRLGHWVVDAVVDHLSALREGPAIRTGQSDELLAALGGPLPEAPGDPEAALRELTDTALAHIQHGDHPRYFARVPGPSSYAGVLGDWLGIGFNALVASWAGGSGPATVELVALGWLAEALGLDPAVEGVLVSGGSMANLTALAAARAAVGRGVVYVCDQTHASILRDLRAIGVAHADIRMLATDEGFRLPASAVAEAISADRAAGRAPGIVVATAGTTNCGVVDELDGLADLCAAEDVWLHVDGAYGAPGALCAAGRVALRGLNRADSLVVDPHKWLFCPYDIGCVFVRRPGALTAAFSMDPEYLVDTRAASGEVDLRNRGLELSRRARGLKLWLTFRTYGAARLRAAVQRGIELAEHAQRLVVDDPRWELVTPAQLGIVTFALHGAAEPEHGRRAAALAADGYAAVTSTTLRGRSVLRLCTINPLTTESEIAETLERLAADPRPAS
jgi:aromatic-L-amino-acid decarboxylase